MLIDIIKNKYFCGDMNLVNRLILFKLVLIYLFCVCIREFFRVLVS